MNSRDTLVTELNVLENFNPIVPDGYRNAEVVMLGNLHPSVQMGVLDQMENRPKLVILDTMNFWMDCALDELHQVLKRVDVVTINDEEARQLTGQYSLVVAARMIHEMGPKYVVIKKGEHGALLFHNEHVFYAPALPLEEVFDPTGAGDAYRGGFFAARMAGLPWEVSGRVGALCSSYALENMGTTAHRFTIDEFIARYEQFFGEEQRLVQLNSGELV